MCAIYGKSDKTKINISNREFHESMFSFWEIFFPKFLKKGKKVAREKIKKRKKKAKPPTKLCIFGFNTAGTISRRNRKALDGRNKK